MVARGSDTVVTPRRVVELLREVKDPEVPVLDIVELGIVRQAIVDEEGVVVEVTPTYSGCPAMRAIEEAIVAQLEEHGIGAVSIRTVLDPPWTTDWMTEDAREKLREYGIAPPGEVEQGSPIQLGPTTRRVPCPFCGSSATTLKSAFGSTACKSLHYCDSCHQPFEYFKPH